MDKRFSWGIKAIIISYFSNTTKKIGISHMFVNPAPYSYPVMGSFISCAAINVLKYRRSVDDREV